MRKCPNCDSSTISILKLAFQRFVPGIVASCDNCYAIVDIKNNDSLFSAVIAEWILTVFLLASFVYFEVLWSGIVFFIAWRLIRFYFKLKGSLVNVQQNS